MADTDDLSPSEFVKKIRELGEKKDAEDAERLATLERDILQGRKERELRRAERARSVSPEKKSPMSAMGRSRDNITESSASRDRTPEISTRSSETTTKMADDGTSEAPPPSATQLARSGTLSWAQRPKSRDGRRPLSWMASENAARSPRGTPEPTRATPEPTKPLPEPSSESNQELSRAQIAESLATKDPTWFKQTADRGVGSAAYRRNQEEDTDMSGTGIGKMRLPGLSRDTSVEAEGPITPPPDSLRSTSPSRASSVRGSALSSRYSSTTAATDSGSLRMKSPPASILDAPKLEASTADHKSPLGARPPSPTKGMGGFVESAMLKRADSVSKRWSAVPGQSLSRQNSTASNSAGTRSSYMASYGGGRTSANQTSPASRDDSSLEPHSRPTSSHSNTTATQSKGERTSNKEDDVFKRPSLPYHHSRSKSVASIRSQSNDHAEPSPPASPSKRWSPTKSSWLETALTKEEKSKLTTQTPPPSQPSWMAEINKAKLQRANSPTKELVSPPLETKVLPRPGSPVKQLSSAFEGREVKPEVENKPAPEVKIQDVMKAELPRASSPVKHLSSTFESLGAKSEKPVSEDLPTPSLKTKELAKSAPPEPAPSLILLEKAVSPPIEAVKVKSPPPEIASKPANFVKDQFKTPSSPSPVSTPTSQSAKSSFDNSTKPASPAAGKFDFRANLKSRAPPSDSGGKSEPEFKNALGNLKRAKTQNFVAPDTLKDNILRGKSGLAITGGPAPRKRVDELKESLLAQKAAMKAKVEAGEAPVRPQKPAELPSTPEALARRKTLSRSESGSKESAKADGSEQTPEAIAAMQSLRGRGGAAAASSSKAESLPKSPPVVQRKVSSPVDSAAERAERGEPDKKVIEKTSPPVVQRKIFPDPASTTSSSVASRTSKDPIVERPAAEKPASFALPGMVKPGVSSKLAERFNPALSNMLARGPPASGGSNNASPGESPSISRTSTNDATAGPLDHKTKGRARGPKRRAPAKAAEMPATSTVTSEVVNEVKEKPKDFVKSPVAKSSPQTPAKHVRIPSVQLVKPQHVLASSPVNARSHLDTAQSVEDTTSKASAPLAKPKPAAPAKSPLLSATSPKFEESKPSPKSSPKSQRAPLREQQGNSAPIRSPTSPLPSPAAIPIALPTPPTEHVTQTPTKASVAALFEQRMGQTPPPSRVQNQSPASIEDFGSYTPTRTSNAVFVRQEVNGPFSSGRRSPVKLPTRADEEKAARDAGIMRPPEAPVEKKKPAALGLGLGLSAQPSASSSSPGKTVPRESPLSPPASARKAPDVNGSASLSTPKEKSKSVAPPESPIPHTSEATRLFADFFDDKPTAVPAEDIDTISILEANPLPSEKVTTIRKQLQEIKDDGKLVPVPSHQEHMLFDGSMYVCTHHFTTSRRVKSTEVYLWAGCQVPPAALEDAQLFGRRVAKDNGGKLIVIQQGHETPTFLQALGGILIIFKGTKSRNSTGVPSKFVLCGRQHLGHIVFDEVDFSLHSFCSGFPYLISANNRLYLWKGIGSHQEEISSARLITMDVSATPDLVEIEEGKEPASFFALFPALPKYPKNTIPRSADHWRLKTRNDKYKCRLFRVEQVRSNSSNKSMSLQVSTFFSNVIKRRPSWSSPLHSPVHETSAEQPSPTCEQPRTPSTSPPPGLGSVMGTRIVEIAPFTQDGVSPEAVFVLDAFFEIYVIIGPLAQSQARAFAAALHFAQDYGILAASMQDRPFVPVSTVVVEGAPRDMKFCFRRWDADRPVVGHTEKLMEGKAMVRRAGSLRCVGLSAALASLREG